jgi:hypothetical protein|tara:strand:- start:365 stop:598 length:234 start_codon:yes stop_codon:yes gene_type:complete
MQKEEEENKNKNLKIIFYFILVVFAWSSISTMQDSVRSYFLNNVYDNVYLYCVVVFVLSVITLYYCNGFKLEGCGLV